jgi:hypothetical protein
MDLFDYFSQQQQQQQQAHKARYIPAHLRGFHVSSSLDTAAIKSRRQVLSALWTPRAVRQCQRCESTPANSVLALYLEAWPDELHITL